MAMVDDWGGQRHQKMFRQAWLLAKMIRFEREQIMRREYLYTAKKAAVE